MTRRNLVLRLGRGLALLLKVGLILALVITVFESTRVGVTDAEEALITDYVRYRNSLYTSPDSSNGPLRPAHLGRRASEALDQIEKEGGKRGEELGLTGSVWSRLELEKATLLITGGKAVTFLEANLVDSQNRYVAEIYHDSVTGEPILDRVRLIERVYT